jgi:hypothetical protein
LEDDGRVFARLSAVRRPPLPWLLARHRPAQVCAACAAATRIEAALRSARPEVSLCTHTPGANGISHGHGESPELQRCSSGDTHERIGRIGGNGTTTHPTSHRPGPLSHTPDVQPQAWAAHAQCLSTLYPPSDVPPPHAGWPSSPTRVHATHLLLVNHLGICQTRMPVRQAACLRALRPTTLNGCGTRPTRARPLRVRVEVRTPHCAATLAMAREIQTWHRASPQRMVRLTRSARPLRTRGPPAWAIIDGEEERGREPSGEVDCDVVGGGRGATQAGASGGSRGTSLRPLTLNKSLPVAVLERLRDSSDHSGKVSGTPPPRASLVEGGVDGRHERSSGASAVKVGGTFA